MYCHTLSESSFAGMKISKNKKKKRVTPSSKDQNQGGSKAKLKRKGNQTKSNPMPKMCTNHLSVLQNNVKRGKVRVRSAKGVRKFITSNVRLRREGEKTGTPKQRRTSWG